jgi:hypothetical protein
MHFDEEKRSDCGISVVLLKMWWMKEKAVLKQWQQRLRYMQELLTTIIK